MGSSITARYYLGFTREDDYLKNVRKFFDVATTGMDQPLIQGKVPHHSEPGGAIVELIVDERDPSAGYVTYEFSSTLFSDGSISSLLGTLLYSAMLPFVDRVRLLSIDIPESFTAQFEGPRIGLSGIRKIILPDSPSLPLFGVVIKPRIGLSMSKIAEFAIAAMRGGAQYAVEDELLTTTEFSSPIERMQDLLTAPGLARAGRFFYIFSLRGQPKVVLSQIEKLSNVETPFKWGVMLNGMTLGFDTLNEIISAAPPHVPFIANKVTSSMQIRSRNMNVAAHVFAQLSRLAGADAVYSTYSATEILSDPSKIHVLPRYLSTPPHKPSMPVYSGSVDLRTMMLGGLPSDPNFMVQAGSSIYRHSARLGGSTASVRRTTEILTDALTALYSEGVSPADYARSLASGARTNIKGIDLASLGLDGL